MTIFEHVLPGCAPIPLAAYLKGLGVLRLVAEQADENARGFWRDERFVLKTRLSVDELVRFFAEDYRPSPIISPWNGRAGFLEGEDEESSELSSRQGAELIRSYESSGERFKSLRESVQIYRSLDLIKNLDKARSEAKSLQQKKRKKVPFSDVEKSRLKELEAFIKGCRASVIVSLRSSSLDVAIDWFDACQRITQERVPFPLLGSGGLDGSRDFGVNFGSALASLFDLASGAPSEQTEKLVRESLGFDIAPLPEWDNLGQYEPAGGGENTSTGFSGGYPFNPADLILLLEGAMLFSGATTRRLEGTDARSSFPFTVSALTAGSGATSPVDDQGLTEFWAPLWTRPACLSELSAFLAEGRTTFDGRTPKDGLEFAVAVNTLGVQRGIPEYQRFALLQREPRNPKKATPLGRVRAKENPRASLITDLGHRGWLARARSVCRDKSAPASLADMGRDFDESLFRLASVDSREPVQAAMVAFGTFLLEVARRPKLHESLPLPTLLSTRWMTEADDGSPEFALAASLASLNATAEGFRLPFRRHLVPIGWPKGRETWSDETEARALAVWSGRDLARDMAVVLERRLIEAQRHDFRTRDGRSELPLHGVRFAPLAAVAAFLAGRVDEKRIAALTAGLAWVVPRGFASIANEHGDALPFAYVALKPLFSPDGVGPAEINDKKRIDPLPLVRLVRARRVDDATWRAQFLARGAGLAAPFASLRPTAPLDPNRLAAALLFPIAPEACDRLIARAYPDVRKDKEEETHAD